MQDMFNKTPLIHLQPSPLYHAGNSHKNWIQTSHLQQHNIYAVTQGNATSNSRWQCSNYMCTQKV